MGFKRNSAYLLILNAFGLVSGAVTTFVVARGLGPEGKGVLYLVFLLPQLVSGLGGLGLRSSAVYFAGRGCDRRQLVRLTLALGLGLSLVYLAAALLLQRQLADSVLKGLATSWILLASALIPVYLISAYLDGLLHGFQKFGVYTVLRAVSLVLKLVLVVVGLNVLGFGLTWVVAAYVASAVIPMLLTLGVVLRHATPGGPKTTVRTLYSYGLAGHLGNVAQQANLRLDVLLINPIVGTAAVGVYSVAVQLAELTWQIPNAVSQVLLPRIAGSGEREAETLTRTGCRHTVFVSILSVTALGLVAYPVVRLLGVGFDGAPMALWLLLPGVVALCVSKILTKYLAGRGKPILNSWASLVALLVNLPALFILVPRYGINGASLATTLAYTVQTLVVLIFFLRESTDGLKSALILRRSDLGLYRELIHGGWTRIRRPRTTSSRRAS